MLLHASITAAGVIRVHLAWAVNVVLKAVRAAWLNVKPDVKAFDMEDVLALRKLLQLFAHIKIIEADAAPREAEVPKYWLVCDHLYF